MMFANRSLTISIVSILLIAASCTGTGNSELVEASLGPGTDQVGETSLGDDANQAGAESLEDGLCDVSDTSKAGACRRVSASNPNLSSEVLPTGEEISCFVSDGTGPDHYQVESERNGQLINTGTVEFDPSTLVDDPDGSRWAAPSSQETIYFSDGFVAQEVSGRYRATLIDQWVRDIFEPSVDYPDVWLVIRACGASPYPSLIEFLRQQGMPADLVTASEVLHDLHGQGTNVKATTAAFESWLLEMDPETTPVEWIDRDPRFRSFDDVPETLEPELDEVDIGVRVPAEWRQRPVILCLRSPGGWSGCIETTAVTDEDYEAEGIPLSGYRFPGEPITVALVPDAKLFDISSDGEPEQAPHRDLGTLTPEELDSVGVSIQITTESSPEALVNDSTTSFAFKLDTAE